MTVYEHLDGTLSIGYGPHTVGRYSSEGVAIRCGGRRRSPVASRQHHLALTLRRPTGSFGQRQITFGRIMKPDISRATYTGHFNLLTTTVARFNPGARGALSQPLVHDTTA